jgi:[acyl-carrier-protein] S-malonyltransferase
MNGSAEKTAFLFPGQGSQSVGMMSAFELAASLVESTFADASSVLGYDLLDVVASGPETRLNQTEVTQPAVLAAGVATWRIWRDRGGGTPDYVAGHSLGEYTALVVAGALDFQDAIGLVAERGRSMQMATPDGSGAMAAILGLEEVELAGVCERATAEFHDGEIVSCANFNAPGQTVIAGSKVAVERACSLALTSGARKAIPLAVSVPSHCALMIPAAERMRTVMEQTPINPPEIPVLHNWNAARNGGAEAIREALIKQLSSPVRWTDTIRGLVDNGVKRFAECGPGKVLAGLNRRIDRSIETVAFIDVDVIGETAEHWGEQ